VRIRGKRVILTGASSGIGRALALSFAARGAELTLAARREDRLADLVREIGERSGTAPPPVAVSCDVSDPADVQNLIGGTVERIGRVDMLVNNAGICVYGEAGRTSIDDYRDLMAVNFYGPLHAMREVMPFMLRQESGLMVNVATVAALHGVPYLAAYAASKAALVALSQSLRAELADTGVRVMLVYPGYTESEIYEHERRVGGARRPEFKYAPAEDVAEAIVRAIESGARDLILTRQGRALNVLRGLAPPVVERAMRKIARELRCPDDAGDADPRDPSDGKEPHLE
jgi:short-subunit dehydrogenase